MVIKLAELAVIICYFAICAGIGLFYRRRATSSIVGYWAADRKIGPFINGTAIFAAWMSAGSALGFIGLGYKFGFAITVGPVIGVPVAALLAIAVLAGPFRRAGIYTVPDYFDIRFKSRAVRVVALIVTFIFCFFYIIPQLKAAGLVAAWVTGLDFAYMVLIIGIILLAYVAIGGMWAITITDFMQGILMLIGIIGTSIAGLILFGGYGPLIEQVGAIAGPKLGFTIPWYAYVGFILTLAIGAAAFPHTIMRIFTTKNPSVARDSYTVTILLCTLLQTIGYIGIIGGAIIINPKLPNPDLSVLVVAEYVFPPVVTGLVVAGILAAVMSSADAFLLAANASIVNDLVTKVIKPTISEKLQIRLATIVSIILGFACIGLTLVTPGLIGILIALVIGIVASAFFFPLYLGVWWKRANKYGAIAGMIAGPVVFAIVQLSRIAPMMTGPLWGVIASFICFIVVSLVTPAQPEVVKELERKHII
jgi:SSS family transporter